MGRLKTTRGKGMDLDSKSKKTQRRQQREKTQTVTEVQGTPSEFEHISEGLPVSSQNHNSICVWQSKPHCSELCSFHLSHPGCLWTISSSSQTTTERNQELICSLGWLYLVQNKNAVTAEWPYIYWLTRWRELLTYVSPEPPSFPIWRLLGEIK